MYLSQLFTQEEFKAIQLKQFTSQVIPRKSKKQQIHEMIRSQEERRQTNGEILSESVIETVDHNKRRLDKEARVAMVQVCIYLVLYNYSCSKILCLHALTVRLEEKEGVNTGI